MPLTFSSLSHGKVAFGFFNIESDMLLLENYFFFSTAFCHHLFRLARRPDTEPSAVFLPGYIIDNPEDTGDLMGAINGIRYTGFIGDVYRQFPFPDNPRNFKQNPKCANTQDAIKKLISRYTRLIDIPFTEIADGLEITIGDYRFSRPSFHQIIGYVWQGGYPRWKDGIRPSHVRSMKEILLQCQRGLFVGLSL